MSIKERMMSHSNYDHIRESDQIVYCTECCNPCERVEEAFDYSGTHCTFGRSGTHHTGHYVSDCCSADMTDDITDLYSEDEFDR